MVNTESPKNQHPPSRSPFARLVNVVRTFPEEVYKIVAFILLLFAWQLLILKLPYGPGCPFFFQMDLNYRQQFFLHSFSKTHATKILQLMWTPTDKLASEHLSKTPSLEDSSFPSEGPENLFLSSTWKNVSNWTSLTCRKKGKSVIYTS